MHARMAKRGGVLIVTGVGTVRRPGQLYAFGDFQLDAGRRVLSRRATGETVATSAAAVDTLLQLVEHAGETIDRQTILRAVWPDVTVVENSVNQVVSALRRALGDDPAAPVYVATVPGRGYRFLARVVAEDSRAHDPVAYQHYVTGWSKVTRSSLTTLNEAMYHFEQAIAIEPDFALAHVGVAECCHMLSAHDFHKGEDILPVGRRAAERALAIAPDLVEARVALVRMEELMSLALSHAEARYRVIIADHPRCFSAHRYLGVQLMNRRRLDEALVLLRIAQSIEPLAVTVNVEVGMALYFSGRNAEAVRQLELTLAMDPTFEVANAFLGRALVAAGDPKRAIAVFRNAPTSAFGAASGTPIALAAAGRLAEAKAMAEKLADDIENGHGRPHDAAQVYAALREDEKARLWLERAFSEFSGSFFAVDPVFAHLHQAAWFRDWLDRLERL